MGKAEGYFFAVLGVFLVIADVVYWLMSNDPTGTACLGLSGGFGAIAAFYLNVNARRAGPRPEDRSDAEIGEGAGDVAHFSPGSPWPIGLAFSANLVVLGFVFGLWITFIAVGLLLFTVTGLLFEHYRGNNLHTEELIGVDPVGVVGGSGH